MLRVHDQQPIQTLGTNRAHKSFRDCVRLWCLNRCSYDANTGTSKHVIKTARELRVVIANQHAHGL